MPKQVFHFSYRKTEELHKIAKDLKKNHHRLRL